MLTHKVQIKSIEIFNFIERASSFFHIFFHKMKMPDFQTRHCKTVQLKPLDRNREEIRTIRQKMEKGT